MGVPRAADESGFALPLALLACVVFGLATTSIALYVVANQHAAQRSGAAFDAQARADAGLDYANSILYQSADLLHQSGFPYGAEPATPQLTVGRGSTSFWAVFDPATSIWTLYSVGRSADPSNPGRSAAVKVSRKVHVIPGQTTANLSSWNGLYAALPNGGCMTLSGGITVTDPAYVNGDLCISGGSHFTGSQLQVAGSLTVNGGSSVGQRTAPISRLSVRGGTSVTGGSAIYATTQDHNVDTVSKPTVDIAYWYAHASPGPLTACTTRTGSVPLFDTGDRVQNWSLGATNLTPGGSAYSCKTTDGSGATVGELTWTGGFSGGTLTVKGVIFFDGPVVMNAGVTANYVGQATIYASSFTINGGAKLCGATNCASSWDPSTNLLVLVAGQSSASGYTLNGGSSVQAAVYCVADASISGGGTHTGPITAGNISISGGAILPKSLSTLPSGAPQNTVTQAPTLEQVPNSYRVWGSSS